MLIYEKLPLTFDIEKLKRHLHEVVLPIGNKIFQIEGGFGGWSVQSNTGRWQDGWEAGQQCFNEDGTFDYAKAKELNVLPDIFHDTPTEICTGYLSEIIQQIHWLGFFPRRARISELPSNSKSTMHRDGKSDIYVARIHIPIITNEQCIHTIYDNEQNVSNRLYLPADGSSYIVAVNNLHRVSNNSTEARYHLMMNVWDTKGVTKTFRFHNMNTVEERAKKYMENIAKV